MRAPRNLPFLLKAYFIIGGVVIVAFAIIYNNGLIREMRAQSKATTQLFSQVLGVGFKQFSNADNEALIHNIREAVDIPFILTDAEGKPWAWNREIGIPLAGIDYDRIKRFNPAAPNDAVLERVLRKAAEFDRMNEPMLIEGTNVEGPSFAFLLHYGASSLSRKLAVAPYVQLGVLVIFMLFGFLGFRAVQVGEQRSIWVGMAKETAHQLGTPLSSIMGWLVMIREELGLASYPERLTKAVEEVSTDVDRLGKISARFSKIGSAPKLEYQELAPIIEETVDYFERRRPTLKIASTITVTLDEFPLIRCSRELIGWVFENMVKNSLDAIAGEEGKIHIEGKMNAREKRVEILFGDTGKGMSPGVRNRVFEPGFTTKSRGWGLGLALVKRIVEEIHGGSIRVLHTQPGKGTTFLITFPVD
jgi:two-component sensor histidine kinase